MATIPVICDDPTPAARDANIAALAMQQVGPKNKLAVNGPLRRVYVPPGAMFEIPGHLAGEGHTFIGEGHIAKITSGSGSTNRRVLENFGFENETVLNEAQQDVGALGSHITFDSQQDLNGLIMDQMFFGKGWRHLDQQRLNPSGLGGALRRVSLRDCEFTGATYASRMFRHAIGYSEHNTHEHHNAAGHWFASGANEMSVADVTLHGHFHHNQRYSGFIGGDVGNGLTDGFTYMPGTLFESNSLKTLTDPNPIYKFGDVIVETTTTRGVRGMRFMEGCRMGVPTAGQIERIGLSPNGGGQIHVVDIGDMVAIGGVPLFTQVNGKVKVVRSSYPVPEEQTEVTVAGQEIFGFHDRNGNRMQGLIDGFLHVTAVDAANPLNRAVFTYWVTTAPDGHGCLSIMGSYSWAIGAQLWEDPTYGSPCWIRRVDGTTSSRVLFQKTTNPAIPKVKITAKFGGAYNG